MDSSDTDDNLISPTVDDLPVGEDESVQNSGAKAPARHRPRVLKPLVWLGLTLMSVFFVAALDFMPMYYWMPAGMGTASVDSIGLRATILKNIDQGITYMLCSMGILLLHEFGQYCHSYLRYSIHLALLYPLSDQSRGNFWSCHFDGWPQGRSASNF